MRRLFCAKTPAKYDDRAEGCHRSSAHRAWTSMDSSRLRSLVLFRSRTARHGNRCSQHSPAIAETGTANHSQRTISIRIRMSCPFCFAVRLDRYCVTPVSRSANSAAVMVRSASASRASPPAARPADALPENVQPGPEQIQAVPEFAYLGLQCLRLSVPTQPGAALPRARPFLTIGQRLSALRAFSPRGRHKRTCAFCGTSKPEPTRCMDSSPSGS
jgi:hypothetical protein